MIRTSKSHIFFSLLFQALAVCIICIGSLINFHQYKIWGKPLIPQFDGYKRDSESSAGTLSLTKISKDNSHVEQHFSGSDCTLPAEFLHLHPGCSSFTSVDLSQNIPGQFQLRVTDLRGPPQA